MKKETIERVRHEFYSCITNTAKRVEKASGNYRPFHSKLLSEKMLAASLFERSFSTSFGQRVIETIAKVIALDINGTEAVETGKATHIEISNATNAEINKHLLSLRENTLGRPPSWEQDINSISTLDTDFQTQRIISDLWFKRNSVDYFFSIKTVKPNIDQTAEAKKDLMRLRLSKEKYKCVYFALPYNPYGEQRDLYKHSPPFKIFDMTKDSCVLIGEQFWATVGDQNTYSNLLKIAEDVGKETNVILKKLGL